MLINVQPDSQLGNFKENECFSSFPLSLNENLKGIALVGARNPEKIQTGR